MVESRLAKRMRAMTDLQHPKLPRRLMALVYDTFLVLPLIMLSVAIALAIQLAITGADSSSSMDNVKVNPAVVQLLAFFTVAGFYTWFWRLKGQTLGMQAWRIRLRSIDGSPVTVAQAMKRCAGAVVSLGALGAGYWWCLFDANQRYWHDIWSGTELELLPKPDKT